jgi:hypothetical protein
VLSYGLGRDSSGILVRWLLDPASRDFDLSELIVIHANTGAEFHGTHRDVDIGRSGYWNSSNAFEAGLPGAALTRGCPGPVLSGG